MAVLPIRIYPDPVLREETTPVDEVDDTVRELVRDLAETMYAAPGIGLAAPQVGVQRRVVVYDIGDGLHALVNPRLTLGDERETDEEGCLSIPGLAFPVERALTITVHALDEEGQELRYEAEDLEARVIQHEVDHVDGVLFLDRLERDVRKDALRILRERALAGPETPIPHTPSASL